MSGLVPWAGNLYPVPSTAPTSSPVPASPTLREFWKELHTDVPVPTRGQSAVVGLRQNSESALMGALLAFIDTDLGGLDLLGRIPLDWVGAVLFYALSIRDANNSQGLSTDFRALGQSCTTIAMYRMVHRWREGKKGIPYHTVSGDPVLSAGKSGAF